MTFGTLRLKIRTFERGTIPKIPAAAPPLSVVRPAETTAPEFDEDGRLYAFRFERRRPEPVVMNRDRIFDYLRRRRPTVDGSCVSLLPDIRVRGFLRDLRNRADFFTDVRDLQTHADVELYQPEPRFRRGKTEATSFRVVS